MISGVIVCFRFRCPTPTKPRELPVRLQHRSLLRIKYFLLLIALSTSGCSPTSKPNYASLGLVDVRGVLTLDGVPLADVEVRLETPEDLIYSYGITDAAGKFRLMFDSRTAGIIPGKKRVLVFPKPQKESETTRRRDFDEGEVDEGEGSSIGSPRVPDCYGRESKKYLDISSTSTSIEITLRSDCSDSQ